MIPASDPSRRTYFQRLIRMMRPSETKQLVVVALILGGITGLVAFGFSWMVEWVTDLAFVVGKAKAGWMGPVYLVLVPALGGLLVGPIVTNISKEAKGHGVPEVMLAVARGGGRIRAIVALAKAVASAICIGSGGSAGKEGPIVQIGSSLGSTIGRLFRFPPDLTKMLVACGAASGIAATFGTPLAGVMFALEVILNEFASRAFSMVVIAAVAASAVSKLLLGDKFFFSVPAYHWNSSWELIFYAILGVAAALTARFFVWFLYTMEDYFDEMHFPEWLKPALGGALLGVVGLLIPQILGTGHHVTESALWGKLSFQILVVLALAKIVATTLTLGSGGSGGIFSPSLFTGAMLGGALGYLFNFFFPDIAVAPGAYAIVGMGAVFAGATRAPITAVLILFEMTNDYHIIIPIMMASVTSTLVSHALSEDTVYTLKLRRRGIILGEKRPAPILTTIRVESVMTRQVETLFDESSLGSLMKRFAESLHTVLPVLNRAGELVGLVTSHDVHAAFVDHVADQEVLTAKAIMRENPTVAYPHETLNIVLEKMTFAGTDKLPVVERANPKRLVGIVSHHDIVKAYPKEEPIESPIVPLQIPVSRLAE